MPDISSNGFAATTRTCVALDVRKKITAARLRYAWREVPVFPDRPRG